MEDNKEVQCNKKTPAEFINSKENNSNHLVEHGLPQITNSPLPPAFDIPESYNQLNTILSYYSLPNIQATEDFEDKMTKVIFILKNEYLNLPTNEQEDIVEKLKIIKDYKNLEAECDAREIELANMKISVSQKYGNKTAEELSQILTRLRSHGELNAEYELNKNTIRGIYDLEPGAMKNLAFIKENTFGAYAKQRVLDKLKGRNEEWARVLFKIVKENECKVETIGKELEIDRVSLLRIIYNFCAKGILEYDRLEDFVKIKANKH
ncbi:uncharacterized protein VICG_01237 [Vittaforma corneae ATCC 50505]|uniref:Uncharacterized protein n=1 Tax=Vittaforma corneae (strain ATCC 50505) TaxID=993615 RepID=L2GLH3_VITCO|nr:uncharacterized protein VICG_01237 [Vittaforma corneae ATCC 50505]ELA41733.1 hypothetical protein VICG_01237 [Vittaforma corneae ATCC 50505]